MRALVVFESMFGNTKMVADAIAVGLSARMKVDVVEVSVAPAVIDNDLELLVVGGPTHTFGMSRPATRQEAARHATDGVVSPGAGLREWLATVRGGSSAIAVAAFDTRVQRLGLPGSAARAAEKRLRRLGFRVVARRRSFYVAGTPGPLLAGEAERARRWGEELGSAFAAKDSTGGIPHTAQ